MTDLQDPVGLEVNFSQIFAVPDTGHFERIDWRRVQIRIHQDQLGWTHLRVTIRRKAGGRTIHDLFESSAFRGVIDELFEDILSRSLPGYADLSRPLYPVLNATTRGMGDGGRASPQMSFRLNTSISDRLAALSAHQVVGLHMAAKSLSEAQEGKRSAR